MKSLTSLFILNTRTWVIGVKLHVCWTKWMCQNLHESNFIQQLNSLFFFNPHRSCMRQCKDRSSNSLDCDIYQWDHKQTRASYTSCKEIISNWLVTIHVHLVYHQCITCDPISKSGLLIKSSRLEISGLQNYFTKI